mmetsp:Transcript_31672/g.92892  ORF Transcript_31672/g.92892 Transcript_31672/m.92892 type:complete len:257 (-) Transcript_31672:313-1083(-)
MQRLQGKDENVTRLKVGRAPRTAVLLRNCQRIRAEPPLGPIPIDVHPTVRFSNRPVAVEECVRSVDDGQRPVFDRHVAEGDPNGVQVGRSARHVHRVGVDAGGLVLPYGPDPFVIQGGGGFVPTCTIIAKTKHHVLEEGEQFVALQERPHGGMERHVPESLHPDETGRSGGHARVVVLVVLAFAIERFVTTTTTTTVVIVPQKHSPRRQMLDKGRPSLEDLGAGQQPGNEQISVRFQPLPQVGIRRMSMRAGVRRL